MENTQNTCSQLNGCLFFSSSKLARVIGKTAEEAFKITGLSPSHAFLLHIVNHSSGIHQKKIGEMLHMTPSTITRFVEKLENKGLIKRQTDGKNVHLFTANKGLALQPEIVKAWERLHDSYSGILTPEESGQFFSIVSKLISQLEDSNFTGNNLLHQSETQQDHVEEKYEIGICHGENSQSQIQCQNI